MAVSENGLTKLNIFRGGSTRAAADSTKGNGFMLEGGPFRLEATVGTWENLLKLDIFCMKSRRHCLHPAERHPPGRQILYRDAVPVDG